MGATVADHRLAPMLPHGYPQVFSSFLITLLFYQP
jgi:hypothetical protein